MPVSADFAAYVIDQLSPLGRVVSRRMFSGVGLYADGLFFALIADDTLYFKVDDSTRPAYVARGCRQFQPFADQYSMSYYAVPADVLEDPDDLAVWARGAVRVAATAAAAKFAGTRRKKK